MIDLAPSFLPVQTEQQKQNNVQSNNARAGSATIFNIFIQNYAIALVTFIPVIGWGFIGAVMWNTGLVIASYNQPFWQLTSIFAWIELSIYSFVIVQSLWLVQIWLKRKTTNMLTPIIKTILITASVVAIVLVLSAILEFVVIRKVSI